MANLKEIRNRISSVSSTMKITSAMKMVSAAKLKKAQDAIVAMRPYSNKLTGILQDLSSSIDSDNIFIQNRETNKKLIVCITSNRGLCGGFNSNIIKECIGLVKKQNNGETTFFCLGKKGDDILSKKHSVVLKNNEIFKTASLEKSFIDPQRPTACWDKSCPKKYEIKSFIFNLIVKRDLMNLKMNYQLIK